MCARSHIQSICTSELACPPVQRSSCAAHGCSRASMQTRHAATQRVTMLACSRRRITSHGWYGAGAVRHAQVDPDDPGRCASPLLQSHQLLERLAWDSAQRRLNETARPDFLLAKPGVALLKKYALGTRDNMTQTICLFFPFSSFCPLRLSSVCDCELSAAAAADRDLV